MISMNEQLYGKEFNDQQELLKADLENIETKHIEWFKARKGKMPSDEHDKLHDHYKMNWNVNGIGFGFRKDSPLPKDIINECMKAFHNRFPSK